MDLFFIFILGIIVGLFINKKDFSHIEPDIKELFKYPNPNHEKAQFLDPIPFKEKFDNANNITDLLK